MSAGTGVDGVDDRLRLSDVGKLARRARRRVVGAARADERTTFHKLIVEHLGVDPSGIDVVQETWPTYDHVNVQAGLNAWHTSPGRDHQLVGIGNIRHREFGLSDLMRSDSGRDPHGPAPGNVERVNLVSGPGGAVRPCVVAGVYLVEEGGRRAVLLFRADLILPSETVAAITRQVVGVAQHRDKLLAARQHLKRGLLLYGPPGVGKTHTVRYLTSRLVDTTIVQLSGNTLHLVGAACSVARTLQPEMIVIEDVDLIAEERRMHRGEHPMLFQLLNEMDGLAEDADVVFLLTTNRADVLEPALAARPGRVDQAVRDDPRAAGRPP